MKHHTSLITIIGLVALAFSPCLAGCKKSQNQAGGEFAAGKLGLPAGTQELGADEMGRRWYKTPGADDPDWMYEPKEQTVYAAKKDAKSGEWTLKAKPEVTASSLGLAMETVELGKDPNGMYWFEVPGGEKRFAYNTKNKTLYNAQKDAAGKWELGAPFTKP